MSFFFLQAINNVSKIVHIAIAKYALNSDTNFDSEAPNLALVNRNEKPIKTNNETILRKPAGIILEKFLKQKNADTAATITYMIAS